LPVKLDAVYTRTANGHTLNVYYDEMCDSPREISEPLGKMICWHRRYNLGDDHDYEYPEDLLKALLFSEYSSSPASQYGKPVYDFIKSGRAQDARLEYNRSTREWELLENQHRTDNSGWYVSSSYPASLKGADVPDWFLDDCLSALQIDERLSLVNGIEGMVILPLYLYDHSGITMNTYGFSCPWDSGMLGWITCEKKDILETYGSLSPKTIEQAKSCLQAEVEEYDHYLRGDCYGYQITDEYGEEVDSCWGFIGDLDDVKKWMQEQAPTECECLFDENSAQSEDEAEWGDDD
jgi:hypothetical protein